MTQTPIRVLLVDDDEDARELLALYLRSRGLEVTTAEDCQCATDALTGFDADVAVVDVTLPDGDGLELGARLRGHLDTLRLVALSGHAGAEHRNRSTQAGFEAYLVKPVEPDRIYTVISEPPVNAA